jgi:large subunit ribosomal protein L10
MSKYVKNLITDHLRDRFKDVHDALLVNMVGLDANADNRLRAELREKNIHVAVVKNSLARRATEGTALGVMFEGLTGSSAVCWGSDDMVALAREITRLAKDDQYAAFAARGGVMDGEKLTAEGVVQVSTWPSREELLGIVAGQVIGVASEVASQLVGPARQIASQIEKMIEDKGGDGQEAAGAVGAGPTPGASGAGAAPE